MTITFKPEIGASAIGTSFLDRITTTLDQLRMLDTDVRMDVSSLSGGDLKTVLELSLKNSKKYNGIIITLLGDIEGSAIKANILQEKNSSGATLANVIKEKCSDKEIADAVDRIMLISDSHRLHTFSTPRGGSDAEAEAKAKAKAQLDNSTSVFSTPARGSGMVSPPKARSSSNPSDLLSFMFNDGKDESDSDSSLAADPMLSGLTPLVNHMMKAASNIAGAAGKVADVAREAITASAPQVTYNFDQPTFVTTQRNVFSPGFFSPVQSPAPAPAFTSDAKSLGAAATATAGSPPLGIFNFGPNFTPIFMCSGSSETASEQLKAPQARKIVNGSGAGNAGVRRTLLKTTTKKSSGETKHQKMMEKVKAKQSVMKRKDKSPKVLDSHHELANKSAEQKRFEKFGVAGGTRGAAKRLRST